MAFDLVPLRAGERGRNEHRTIERELRGWATSAPMRALVAASGWAWPEAVDTLPILDELAVLSAGWDFRGNRERRFIEDDADVRGWHVPDALIIEAARALGLVEPVPVARRGFSYLVVLAGLARGCINRAYRAAELVSTGITADMVVALGAHRRLDAREAEVASAAGLGELTDEAGVLTAAMRQAFRLGPPSSIEEQRRVPFHATSAHYRWPSVEVIIAPSSEPFSRRANTADQLRHWASVAGLNDRQDVLLLTTQIYVPYQYMETIRILGLEYGCGVYACGVDSATARLPGRPFSGPAYLQEVRSALRAAPMLLRAAQPAPGRARLISGRQG